MACNLLKLPAASRGQLLRTICTSSAACGAATAEGGVLIEREYAREKIGKREQVGYGTSFGLPTYVDRRDYPFPAIRFKELTGNLLALHEKEKGDWKKLSLEEKKELYRANFCQTFAEINSNSIGNFRWALGGFLVFAGIAIWSFIGIEYFCINKDPGANPKTLNKEWQIAATRRMIDQRQEPIWGIGAKWDYEKWQWKE